MNLENGNLTLEDKIYGDEKFRDFLGQNFRGCSFRIFKDGTFEDRIIEDKRHFHYIFSLNHINKTKKNKFYKNLQVLS